MKKVSLFILLVIVLSTVLMAAVPTKMVRLTMINKSDFDVYMKLEGSAVTEAFYYLTVPAGTRDEPEVKIFTVMSDVYDRETWQCDGIRSAGTLIVDGNIRLTFTPCGEFKLYCAFYDAEGAFMGKDICGRFEPLDWALRVSSTAWRVAGEPKMEKVTYFRYLQSELANYPTNLIFDWDSAHLYTGWWTTGCATFWWRSRSWRTPLGCEWRYQY
jgi:hypothetical protein